MFQTRFEYEFEYRIYYTFKFKFKFKVGVTPLPKNRGYQKKKIPSPRHFFHETHVTELPDVIKSTHPRYGTIVSTQDLLHQNTKNNVDDEDLY